MDVKKRPEWARSSTRMVLIMFAIATIILAFMWKISWEQFLIAQSSVFWFFFWTRRKDWTQPEDVANK